MASNKEVKDNFYRISDEVERKLAEDMADFGEDVLETLKRVAGRTKHFVQMETFSRNPGGMVMDEMLEMSIKHAIIEELDCTRDDVQCALLNLQCGIVANDPDTIIVINYLVDMIGRHCMAFKKKDA